jgi:Anti-sigma-K factor rskA, C-terminal
VSSREGPDHDRPDLVGLLAGELGRAETIDMARHLRTCPGCVEELIDVAAANGALISAARVGRDLAMPGFNDGGAGPTDRAPGRVDDRDALPALTLPPKSAPLMRPRGRNRRRRRWSVAAAAAAVIVVLGALGVTAARFSRSLKRPIVAQAALRPLDAPPSATGSVTVAADGSTRELTVRTWDLARPPAQSFYEVWLLDPATLKMLPMGVLPPSGSGSYSVGAGLMSGYSAVDVSLQPNNGNPAHSQTSVLRATYRATTT